jgi:hypothetical protein
MKTNAGKLAVRIGAFLATAVLCMPAFAQGHGGGGFGHGGGFGGGHMAGGHVGAAHFGAGPAHYAAGAAHFAAPNYGAGARIGGTAAYGYHGYVAHTPVAHSSAYAAAGWHGGAVHYPAAVHGYGYGVHAGYYPHYHGYYWGGGYWHGYYWPYAYYGWAYPWFYPVLPAVYATYWWGGVPYYYVNNVYYTYDQGSNGYVVTDPPPVGPGAGGDTGDQGGGAPPAQGGPSGPGGGGDVYMYPKNGQTEQQQAQDRYECHKWAQSQTGFDPSVSGSGGNPDDYHRALIACLDGRGYSAR